MRTARSLTVSPSMHCGGMPAWSQWGCLPSPGGECLIGPRGCMPGLRGCLPGLEGVPAWSWGGACLVRGVPAWSGGGACLVWGVPAWSGGCLPDPRRGSASVHAGTPTPPPPVDNSWHTLPKILPCPKLRLRAVNIAFVFAFGWCESSFICTVLCD